MISLISPAKINLFLRILSKRPDNYHELASLFQTIDLSDTIDFALADQDSFTCNDPSLPTDHTNLVSKAVQLFRTKTGIKNSFSIHLNKNIPQQAGLGGGSSNAATTLWALNFLSDRPATEAQLTEWAGEIGSDISFFFSHGTAYCTGRGEKIRHLESLPNRPLWIVKPKFGLSTPEVYGKLDVKLLIQRDPEAILTNFFSDQPVYFNDLEDPAFRVMPSLVSLKKELLSRGFSDVLMSGSGSSFFCMGEGDRSAIPGCGGYEAQFINRKPNEWY